MPTNEAESRRYHHAPTAQAAGLVAAQRLCIAGGQIQIADDVRIYDNHGLPVAMARSISSA